MLSSAVVELDRGRDTGCIKINERAIELRVLPDMGREGSIYLIA